MSNKLFYKDGVLYAAKFPEEPKGLDTLPFDEWNDYQKAKAEALAESLPVSNPEVYEQERWDNGNWSPKLKEGELYDWSGDLEEVKKLHCDEYHQHTKESCFIKSYKLLPKKAGPINESESEKYQSYCPKCGKVINTNIQGNEMGSHDCKSEPSAMEESQGLLWAEANRFLQNEDGRRPADLLTLFTITRKP